MKSTLSDNKQLFNVKAIAAAGLAPDAIPEGQFAIVDESTNLTVAPVDFDSLPEKFRFVSKLNGKVYYSFDTIDKSCCKIDNSIAKEYQAEQVNMWETTIEHCDCINGFQLVVNIDEQSLIQRDGLTWTHRDFVVDVAPEELLCHCDCSGKHPTYENNVITKVLAEKVNALNSPFYEAEVRNADDDTVVADVDAFIAANEAVNTDDDETNDGPKLKLVIKGKVQPAGSYKDLEANYVYPRGVRLNPVIQLNGDKSIQFTQIQALQYEIGAGYDLRAEEFECMSLYTNLNFYPQLSDGLASGDLVYQFENNTNYNTVSFEFDSKKSGLEDVYEGRYKKFAVLLATEDPAIFATLSAVFVP
jgi:hypothetical protein